MTKVEKLLKHKDRLTEVHWILTQQVTPLTKDPTQNLSTCRIELLR
jgi:hypothetical protein